MKHKSLVVSLFVLLAVALTPVWDAGAVDLFDGKVVLHGKVSQSGLLRTRKASGEIYDIDWMNFRTTLKLEAMWHAYDGPDYQVNVYSVWKNFYDAAADIDSGTESYLRRFSGDSDHGVDEFESYETFRDICRELYFEINHNLFQIRVGKQIISWGETSVARMTDIVNPVDGRGNLNPAYPDFAEIKRGLWMLRLFYTPEDHPMDMIYEFVVIPDFQPNRNWPAGYAWGFTNPQFNMFYNANEANFLPKYRDAPSNWDQPELGVRIRGFLWGFDWTLFYFHHRNDDPVIETGDAVNSVISGLLNPRGRALFGIPSRAKNVYNYSWQNSYGLTLNKTVDVKIPIIPGTSLAMSGNVFRLEALYERNKDHNEILGGNVRRAQHDRYAVAIGWDTKIFLPYITPMFRNKLLTSSTQLFMEWVPERHSNDAIYPWVTKLPKGHHWSEITQTFSYELWNGRIIPAIYIDYQPNMGGGYYAPALAFKPQFAWTFMVRYLDFQDYDYDNNYTNNVDFFTFEVIYEF